MRLRRGDGQTEEPGDQEPANAARGAGEGRAGAGGFRLTSSMALLGLGERGQAARHNSSAASAAAIVVGDPETGSRRVFQRNQVSIISTSSRRFHPPRKQEAPELGCAAPHRYMHARKRAGKHAGCDTGGLGRGRLRELLRACTSEETVGREEARTHSPLLRSLCYAARSGLQGQLSACKM